MFELIFLISVAIYFLQTIIFTIGASKRFVKIDESRLPAATVIVAARDEEENILRCLESLDKLEYPEGKLEIIIVDGNSIDKTKQITEKFIEGRKRFKCISIQPEKDNLKGKANGIDTAIKIAKGEIILTTDADCAVSPLWAKTIASYYANGVGMVNGYTSQIADLPFNGMQSLDFIYLLTVAAGAINLGKPLSAIGNNMSYRKEAYNFVGGYGNISFSVTEDFNLLMAIYKTKKYKLIYPLDIGSLAVSKTCDLKTLFRQKKRWAVGGLKSDIIGYAVMASGFVAHICMVALPFLFSTTGLYLALFKIFVDLFFLTPVLIRLKLTRELKYFWAFELYFIIYVIALPFIVAVNRKVIWKRKVY